MSADGAAIAARTLRNQHGMRVDISPYGGTIQKLTAADRNGHYEDVVLGFDSIDSYLGVHPYFGALIGRYANRIANSLATIDGSVYRLTPGEHGDHLHGGNHGFDKVVWRVEAAETSEQSLSLSHRSPDGDAGYPGELSAQVDYTLGDSDQLSIRYRATTTKTTVVNLSNHSYFNLAAAGAETVLDHVIELHADFFTPVNARLIPTGELRHVGGTPMDMRQPTRIGERIDEDDEQLHYGGGFDHNWVIRHNDAGLRVAARIEEPGSGRIMEVLTTEPGVQFYTGNHLDGTIEGKAGRHYAPRSGFCLETQHFPDSPNQPAFPCTILRPGEIYQSETVYRFLTN